MPVAALVFGMFIPKKFNLKSIGQTTASNMVNSSSLKKDGLLKSIKEFFKLISKAFLLFVNSDFELASFSKVSKWIAKSFSILSRISLV